MMPTVIKSSAFVKDAADLIVRRAEDCLTRRGRFIFGLCGGKTPEPIYAALAVCAQKLEWDRIIVTFGDERCVPPDHADSNFRMAQQALLGKVQIPPQNILRIHGETTPEAAALLCEEQLSSLRTTGNPFQHDLLLLGLGDDGHTASLFPGTAALAEQKRLVVPNFVPKFNSWRITFTYRLINDSRHICFLVNDPKKSSIIQSVLKGDKNFPASSVAPKEELTWLIGQ